MEKIHIVKKLSEFGFEIEDLTLGDFDVIGEAVTSDSRIANSHWKVPGPDGDCGFGGTCFPKDVNAIVTMGRELGVPLHSIEGGWQTNLEVRPERDWKKMKGRAVS